MKPLKPQKYIYKLNGTYLEMNNYNVRINMQDVMFNSEIVISIGHSQLLQWIEELTDTLDNYKIAEQIRKEIRQLKNLDSTREIKREIGEKYLKLYDLQFERHLVSIQFDKKSQFDKCCKKLIINGKKFKRLLGTPGGLKMSTVLFVDSGIYEELIKRINNDRRDYEIKNGEEIPIKHSVSKLEAYFALTSSTSNAVSWPKMIVVPGTFTKFRDDVIEVSDGENENDDPIVKNAYGKEIELEINDGCGIMTPEYSKKVNYMITGNEEIVSGICARCAFLKGMLFTFDFKDFAENVAHKHTVIDAWGQERDVNDADIIVTTSQLKLWNSYRNYEEYETACKNNKYEFRITKISEAPDESRNLNYQFTQSYYFDDEDIEELISPTVNEIEDILQLDPRKSIVYLAGANLNEKNVEKIDNVAKALMIDERLIDDPYVRSRIEHMIQKKIRLAKISTIDVNGNFALISGDPYAMCEDIFGLPVKGLVSAGEIYYKFWMDKNVSEVVCMRAPMCAHYNIVKQKISYNDDAKYWFKYINDCIILNSWDTLRIAESGADCDGDILFTTNNPVLVKKHRKLPALDCQQRGAVKVESSLITDDMIAQSNKRSFKSNVGSITNVGTAMLNLQANYDIGTPEWSALEYRTICIQHFQQLCIDAVKNGFKMKPMNGMWNKADACIKKDSDDPDTIKNKKFNLPLCAHRKPFFFIYRYNTTKVEYDRYVKNVNSKLKQQYGIDLNTLLTLENLSKELEEEKKRFYNRCPVDMSNGTINRIAWAVSKHFDDFNNLVKVKFNKEILKSGIKYDRNDYFKVKEIYNEYKSSLSNLAKKTKQGKIEDDDGIVDKALLTLIFKKKFYEVCSNQYELCDILIDLLYDKVNSKSVVWDICGETIIDNLLKKHNYIISYPERVNENEDFSCCRNKFCMRTINIGGDVDGEI